MAKRRIKKTTTPGTGDGYGFREERIICSSKASIFIPKLVAITM